MLSEIIDKEIHCLLDLLNSNAQPGFVDGTDANRRPRNNRLTRRSFQKGVTRLHQPSPERVQVRHLRHVGSRDRREDRKPVDGVVLAGSVLARTHVDGLALSPRPDDYPPAVEPETLRTRRSHGCTLDDDQPCPIGGPPTPGPPQTTSGMVACSARSAACPDVAIIA